MRRYDLTVGLGITGSFCTFSRILEVTGRLVEEGAHVIPIYSHTAQSLDTRFMEAEVFLEKMEQLTGERGVRTIPQAEPIGPKCSLDAMVIAPCTGNTMAKLCNGIVDSPVLMAAKAHLRNERPLIIGMSTNDALGMNLKNIGMLMNMKHIYFIPFGQDNHTEKPRSMIAHMNLLEDTMDAALAGKQLQPIVLSPLNSATD